jgi:hypothetical protein
MQVAAGKRIVNVAMGATLCIAAAGGRAEAAVGFCGGPIQPPGWCDPFRVESIVQQAGNPADALYPNPLHMLGATNTPRSLAVHVKKMVSVPAAMGAGRDADAKPFWSLLDGSRLPDDEAVGYILSDSLGAVTRTKANGGMPHGVRIDDPALNGNAQAIVVATRFATPGSSTSAVGAWYDGAHWWLYNENLAPMGPAETFFYAEGTGFGGSAVHDAANDYQGIGLYLDDARVNGDPDAVVVPLHAFTGAYNASPLGVWYDQSLGKWVVYNEDGSALAAGQTIHYVTVP